MKEFGHILNGDKTRGYNVGMENLVSSNIESLMSTDPLRELRKDAQKVENLASQRNIQVNINILGALHEGTTGQDILDVISNSDIVTVELPSVAVKAHKRGEVTRVDENGFWGTVLNSLDRVFGVNNNRAAVNAIRLLDDRVRIGQNIPDSFPDLAISAVSMQFGNGVPLEKIDIVDSSVIEEIQSQEGGNLGVYPSKALVMKKGVEHFIHVNRPTNGKDKLSAVLIGGDYMLPTQYFMQRGSEIFGDDISGMAGVELCEFALSHLLRTKVDKTQAEGMLKELLPLLKDSHNKDISLTHIGGAAHNPNLLGIFNEVFKTGHGVDISDIKDLRMPALAEDRLTFFGKHIPIADALSSSRVFSDQVVIDVLRTDKILKDILSQKRDLLDSFCKREVVARDSENAIPTCDNSGQIEYFTVRNLISYMTPQEVEQVLPVDANFPNRLIDFMKANHPGYLDNLEKVMESYENRKANFPPKN